MRPSRRSPSLVPSEVFELLPGLYPLLIDLGEQTSLSPEEFFTLSYIRRFGVDLPDNPNYKVIRRYELGEMLRKAFRFKHEAREAHVLDELANKGFITQRKLSENEKITIFGSQRGRTLVVVLSPAGFEKLDDFNRRLNEIVIKVTEGVPRVLLRAMMRTVTEVVRILLKRGSVRGES